MNSSYTWFTNLIFLFRGLGESDGWTITVTNSVWVIHGAGNHYLYDIIAQLEERPRKSEEEFFVHFDNAGDFSADKMVVQKQSMLPPVIALY